MHARVSGSISACAVWNTLSSRNDRSIVASDRLNVLLIFLDGLNNLKFWDDPGDVNFLDLLNQPQDKLGSGHVLTAGYVDLAYLLAARLEGCVVGSQYCNLSVFKCQLKVVTLFVY
jgi:hypothetical protein